MALSKIGRELYNVFKCTFNRINGCNQSKLMGALKLFSENRLMGYKMLLLDNVSKYSEVTSLVQSWSVSQATNHWAIFFLKYGLISLSNIIACMAIVDL